MSEESRFLAIFGSSGSSGGGGGSVNIYNADGTILTGRNVTITDFVNFGKLKIDDSNIINNMVLLGYKTVLTDVTNYNLLMNSSGHLALNSTALINFNMNNVLCGKLHNDTTWSFGSQQSKLGSAKVEIKGANTLSTASALQIYDGDGTPSLLWDFRNNGDTYFTGDAGINATNTVAINPTKSLFTLKKSVANSEDRSTYLEGFADRSGSTLFNYWKIFLKGTSNYNNNNGIGFYFRSTQPQGTEYGMNGIDAVDSALMIQNYSDSTPRFQLYGGTDNTTGNGYLKFWSSNVVTQRIQIARSGKNFINPDAVGGFSDAGLIVMGDTYVGSEKISLQAETLINATLDMNNNRITNTVVNPSVQEVVSSATFTVNSDEQTDGVLTAMATNLTIASPTGTPVQSQSLIFRFKDDGSARTLTWNAIFRAIGVTLPTTTTASKLLYVGCKYNTTDTKWDVISVQEEA